MGIERVFLYANSIASCMYNKPPKLTGKKH